MHRHVCALISVLLIHSFHRAIPSRQAAAKRQEFTAGVPSANFRGLIAEKRAKETHCAPAKRLEFTVRLPFKSALVHLGLHPLALGPRQRPGASQG